MTTMPEKSQFTGAITNGERKAAEEQMIDFLSQYLPIDGSKPMAENITNTPAGNITSTDVQVAINELDGRIGVNPSFRNKIINGNFDIWQRGITFTSTGYTSDRWILNLIGATGSLSRQSFTLGQTDVPGNPQFYNRLTCSTITSVNNAVSELSQRFEDIAVLAGRNATLSFYVKAATNETKLGIRFAQRFGTGGSSANSTEIALLSLTTSWKKYSLTFPMPSLEGKVLGTNYYAELLFDLAHPNTFSGALIDQLGTIDIAQVQLEEGSVATDFEQRPLGIEVELCQRYYETSFDFGGIGMVTANYGWYGTQIPSSANRILVAFKTRKRTSPTITLYSPNTGAQGYLSATSPSGASADVAQSGLGIVMSSRSFQFAFSTQYNGGFIAINYIADAEL